MTLLRGLAIPTGRCPYVALYRIAALQQPCEPVLRLAVAGKRRGQRRIGVPPRSGNRGSSCSATSTAAAARRLHSLFHSLHREQRRRA